MLIFDNEMKIQFICYNVATSLLFIVFKKNITTLFILDGKKVISRQETLY